jgi:DhnA family fructose-bisphosphate aldolase class Ia
MLVLAADHRARGVVPIENYERYLAVLRSVLPVCDGLLASRQPLQDLLADSPIPAGKRTYLSLNRTGLAGAVFELDDRLVASVASAASAGLSGVKHMVRIDYSDPLTAAALELLGQVLEQGQAAGLEVMVEALPWSEGRIKRDVDSVVRVAVIAHDMGAPLLKLPVPETEPGGARSQAVRRVVESVGVPVLFLGGPRRPDGREAALEEVRDVMAGGAAGLAIGRAVIEDPDPAEMGRLVSALVHAPQ